MKLVLTATTDSMTDTIYDSSYDDYRLSKLTLDEALNEAAVLDWTVPPDTLSYMHMDSIVPLKTIIELRQDGDLLFRGRAFQPYEGLYTDKGLICEGELAFFKDTMIPPCVLTGSPFEMLSAVLTAHNAMADSFKRFNIGTVSVSAAEGESVAIKDPCSASAALGALVSALGGYLTFADGVNGRVINWISADDFVQADQPVRLGQNLLEFSMTVNASEFANRVYAFGALVDGERIALPEPGYFEDEPLVSIYGRISKVMIFSDVDDAQELLFRAYRAYNSARNLVKSISVSALDLGRAAAPDADPELFGYSPWQLGQFIRVISAAHGVDAWYQLVSRSVDLLDPASDVITLGGTPVTISGEIS